jgi:hypothetical protein
MVELGHTLYPTDASNQFRDQQAGIRRTAATRTLIVAGESC